jgi:hypothetical protein
MRGKTSTITRTSTITIGEAKASEPLVGPVSRDQIPPRQLGRRSPDSSIVLVLVLVIVLDL